ncbi:A24 family peptidase [Novosphingobium soli]|uniref:Prepilin type IV endopeptidase peptidase domain-containing protein n=1 Tax=Novosphingobium soli TaxID=574956 RepID=A0ABV6CVB2_9SPHN
MAALGYFDLALLILVLVPVVVLPWEGHRTPDWLYLLLAGSGLAAALLRGGPAALAWSCAAGLGCLLLTSAMVTALRMQTRLRILTGGQLKLMAAGATWVGMTGTLVMMSVAVLTLFLLAAFQQAGAVRRRPDASAIVAVAIVSVAMQQHLPGM